MLSGIHFGAPAGGAPKTAAIIVGRPSDRGLSSLRPSGRRQTARQSGGRPGASLACRSLDWLRIQLGRLRGDQPWTRPSGHWRRSQSNTHRSVVSSWRLAGPLAGWGARNGYEGENCCCCSRDGSAFVARELTHADSSSLFPSQLAASVSRPAGRSPGQVQTALPHGSFAGLAKRASERADGLTDVSSRRARSREGRKSISSGGGGAERGLAGARKAPAAPKYGPAAATATAR